MLPVLVPSPLLLVPKMVLKTISLVLLLEPADGVMVLLMKFGE